jgi:hypothetical protein
MEYFLFDNPQIYPVVADRRVHQALVHLSGVDLPSTDREFLYREDDIAAWLSALGA